ncbi:hypothetical protein BCR34DRAFT_596771 [Clohesyomyces aquaticus]|uniref:Cyanovirin-N domain-containing protein n=1 Tax=Clohesyomyces aquaticus TaxID=1231657 RepID=A0A1Y2A4Z7_9PLEO|nr:hypothetical protein BCR34DRAFT_596771 [Clohesyomyces aquaticus]
MLFVLASIAGAALVAAAPTAKGFTKECTDIELRGRWLVANCLTGADATTRIQSTVFLHDKVTNSEATLKWAVNGAYANSCRNCQIINGASLNCICDHSANRFNENTTLNLEEHISNYNGHLLSDLAGPPIVPSTSSAMKIPSDLSWALSFGNTSCYPPEEDICKGYTIGQQPCPSSPTWSSNGDPANCSSFHWPVAVPVWQSFYSLKIDAPGLGWEFQIYDNVDCKSNPILTVGPKDLAKCNPLSKAGVAWTVKPLWNADP